MPARNSDATELRLHWIKIRVTDDCWLWSGYLNQKGYGVTRIGHKARRAHRATWEMFNGPVPDGKELDHICRIRHCVKPEHLELVTHRDNVLRGNAPTAINARKQKCIRGHPFEYATNGTRFCPICAQRKQDRREFRTHRLAPSDVGLIRLLGKRVEDRVAEQFSISETHVENIVNRRSWKELP